MLDFIEINDDGKLKDRLFCMHLNTVNWKVGKKSIHVENVDCDELSGEFLSGLDNEIKSKYRNRAAEAKEYGKEKPFEWFDDLDLKDGSCFGFSEVYGEKDTDRFTFECKGITYFVDDQYCTNPECRCNEVVLTFFEVVPSMKTQETNFAIRMPFNTDNYKVEFNLNTNKAEMDAIINCFKKHIDNDFELLKARYMKMRVSAIFGGSLSITQFELDESILADTSLNIKKFEGASKDWAMFVLNNRNKYFSQSGSLECNHDNKYDIVIGPVANDDLALLFRTFTNGLIDMDALIKGLKYKVLTNQYSFHTDRALDYLKPVGGI